MERARTGRIVHQDTVPSLVPLALDSTHSTSSSASSRTRPPKIKYAQSLDQGGDISYFAARPPSPPPTRRRPPLQHTACFDQSDFELGRPPPMRTTTEETPDTPSAGRSDASDDIDLPGDVFRSLEDPPPIADVPESRSFGDAIEASYERNFRNRNNEYFYERAGPSSEGNSTYFHTHDVYDTCFTINDPLQIQRMSVTALFEKFCADEREAKIKPLPIRQASETFRTSRLKGISADRISGGFIKKGRADRISTSSLGDQPVTTAGSCFSIFEKRKAKFGKLEKSKRLSTSALYDQSPTSILAKNNRIRSSEIVNKYHSEEFHSRFSSPGENYHNAPSTSKSDNSVSKFKFYENPLERASVAKLYEKFCYDDKIKSPPSFLSKVMEKQQSVESEPKSAKTEPFSAASLSEKTSDIMSSTIMATRIDQSIFNFDLDAIQRENSENRSEILSPDQTDRTDRSASVSNTVQLLFEDPRSNRTSVSDLYEPCFSVSLAPKRPSFKRDIIRHWDLNTLNLRPIDDDSPTTSKFTSESSPDDILQNYDSRSNNSEVFLSELQSTTNDTSNLNGKGQMLEDINEGDSIDDSGKTSPSNSENLLPKSMSSRPSMQKLEPYKPRAPKAEEDFTESTPSSNHESNNTGALTEDMSKLNLNTNCEVNSENNEKSAKKDKQKDSLALRKRTRCFPL